MRSRLGFTVGLLLAVALAATAQAPANPTVATPDGHTRDWNGWLAGAAPVAVLVWASWAPRGAETLAAVDGIAAACRARELGFAVLAVQEELADSAAALGGLRVAWLHDRHGDVLKRHRIVRIPSLVILTADGEVLGRLEPTAEGVRGWKAP